MDRLIWAAWRAFWVGLGASAVLIAQSLLAPPLPLASAPAPAVELSPAPSVEAPPRTKSADAILSRNPVDATGRIAARVGGQS